jgi:hypothetical protein
MAAAVKRFVHDMYICGTHCLHFVSQYFKMSYNCFLSRFEVRVCGVLVIAKRLTMKTHCGRTLGIMSWTGFTRSDELIGAWTSPRPVRYL